MTKRRPPIEGGPSLPMRSVPLRYRGRFYGRGHRGLTVAEQWPRARGTPSSAITQGQNSEFKTLVAYQADQPAGAIATAKMLARGTGYTWRDVIARALTGRLFDLGSLMTDDIQSQLDSITSIIGSILYRSGDGWRGLGPGSNGSGLLFNATLNAPYWGGASGLAAPPAPITMWNWIPTHSSNTTNNQLNIHMYWALAGTKIDGIVTPCTTATSGSKVIPVLYDDAGFTPGNVLATGPAVTTLSAGFNKIPFDEPWISETEQFIYLGGLVRTAGFATITPEIYCVGAFTISSDTPPTAPAPISWATGGNRMFSWPYSGG